MSDVIDRAGWTISNWAKRYDIPRSTAYALIKSGDGPRVTKIPGMNKSIVTIESDVEWRDRLNQGNAA